MNRKSEGICIILLYKHKKKSHCLKSYYYTNIKKFHCLKDNTNKINKKKKTILKRKHDVYNNHHFILNIASTRFLV